MTRTRRIQTGTKTEYTLEDKGNGKFEQVPHEVPIWSDEQYTEIVPMPVQVPYTVPETKYNYTVYRWTPGREVTASGKDTHPVWPELNLTDNEREGKRSEYNIVTVANEKAPEDHQYYRYYRISGEDLEKLAIGGEMDFSLASLESES